MTTHTWRSIVANGRFVWSYAHTRPFHRVSVRILAASIATLLIGSCTNQNEEIDRTSAEYETAKESNDTNNSPEIANLTIVAGQTDIVDQSRTDVGDEGPIAIEPMARDRNAPMTEEELLEHIANVQHRIISVRPKNALIRIFYQRAEEIYSIFKKTGHFVCKDGIINCSYMGKLIVIVDGSLEDNERPVSKNETLILYGEALQYVKLIENILKQNPPSLEKYPPLSLPIIFGTVPSHCYSAEYYNKEPTPAFILFEGGVFARTDFISVASFIVDLINLADIKAGESPLISRLKFTEALKTVETNGQLGGMKGFLHQAFNAWFNTTAFPPTAKEVLSQWASKYTDLLTRSAKAFVVAHEFGHYIAGHSIRSESDRLAMEREADRIAFEIFKHIQDFAVDDQLDFEKLNYNEDYDAMFLGPIFLFQWFEALELIDRKMFTDDGRDSAKFSPKLRAEEFISYVEKLNPGFSERTSYFRANTSSIFMSAAKFLILTPDNETLREWGPISENCF